MSPVKAWTVPSLGAAPYRRGRGTGSGGGGSTTDRDALVYGQYEPDESTTGLLPGWTEASLGALAGNTTATNSWLVPNGTVVENCRVYGDLTFAGSATFRNCYLYGGGQTITSGNVAILTCNTSAARTGVVQAIDCVIKPRVESNGRDCVIGRQFDIRRCYIAGGVDGVGIYTSSTTNTDCQVKMYGCLVDDLVYTYPDDITPSHTDGTHNDCVQYQGGRGVHVKGNSLRGYSHKLPGSGDNPNYPWFQTGGRKYSNGAVIIVQKNTGVVPDNTVIFEENWIIGGGSQAINLKATAPNFVYRNNKHYRDVAIKPAGVAGDPLSGYWIRGDAALSTNTTIVGLTDGTNNNRWVDGPYEGQVLTTPQTRGILWG